jgi:hypothetical protein
LGISTSQASEEDKGIMGLEDQDRQHQQQQKKMKDAGANKGGAAEDSPMVLNPGAGRDGLKALEVGYGGTPDESPVEQVQLTVPTTDDPSLPVWTFRMWVIGLFVCILLSFLNQFFEYRKEPLIITTISAQIVALPLGRFMAATLPARMIRFPFTHWEFTLNPGPFNMKEHVLITIFANAGSAFGNGDAYAVGIVNITKAFYKRTIGFFPGLLVVITTQVHTLLFFSCSTNYNATIFLFDT